MTKLQFLFDALINIYIIEKNIMLTHLVRVV